ncbi:MAG: YjbF family lipoprotein [Pseudomonas sp.]
MTYTRTLLLGLAVAGLLGCNSLTGDALQTIRLAVHGPVSPVTVERVQAAPGPVLLVGLGAAEALMVSNGKDRGLVEWYGVNEMLLTHHGRITQTAGLSVDVTVPLVAEDPFIYGLHLVQDGLEITRTLDYPGLYRTGLRQHARYRRGPLEQVEFMGRQHELLRIDEILSMPELGFKATNHYWVEPESGLVRRSTQHISSVLPPLHLTLARTAGIQP